MSSIIIFDIFTEIVLIVVILHLFSNIVVNTVYAGYLRIFGEICFVGCLLEIISNVLRMKYGADANGIRTVLMCMYLSVYPIMGLISAKMNAIVFSMFSVNEGRHRILLCLPLFLAIALLVVTPFTGLVFRLNPDASCNRNLGFVIYTAMTLLYLFFGMYCFWRYRNVILKTVYNKMDKIYFLVAVAAVFSIVVPETISSYPVFGIGILVLVLDSGRFQSMVDRRTKMFNRKYLKSSLSIKVRSSEKYKIFVVKIDEAGISRYAYGEEYEEKLIRQIGSFLRRVFEAGICYQIDDFCFVVAENSVEYDEKCIRKDIEDRFSMVWRVGKIESRLSAKIGIIECGNPNETVESIMDDIDCIRQSGQEESGVIFISSKDARFGIYKRNARIGKIISDRLATKHFAVHYQPIFSVHEKKIISAEALLRLWDEELGNVPPSEFIPISEKTGSIIELGRYVFEEVCRFINAHDLDEYGIRYIEINLSPVQCMQSQLAGELISIMEKYHISSDRINLEITETAASGMIPELMENMHSLAKQGVKFSMDDYGTGYSNMGSIISLPFHFVKLDKSIVWSAFENEKAFTIMKSSVEMFKKLNMEVIAEGIEEIEQLEQACEMGCDYIQGFYYSKPLPKHEFLNYLTKNNIAAD